MNKYKALVDTIADHMPKRSNASRYVEVARALGISTQGIRHRIAHPETVKAEHILAAEMLLSRVSQMTEVDRAIADIEAAVRGVRRMVFDVARSMR